MHHHTPLRSRRVAGIKPATRANTTFASPPHAAMKRQNSTKSIRRSPVSTFATQLCGTFSRAASPRWESPAPSRVSRNSWHNAAYSDVWIDFVIIPILEALLVAPKIGTIVATPRGGALWADLDVFCMWEHQMPWRHHYRLALNGRDTNESSHGLYPSLKEEVDLCLKSPSRK